MAVQTQTRTKVALAILTTFALLALAGCQSGPPEYVYSAPEDLGDGLAVGTIEEVGIDFNLIGNAVDRIWDGDFKAIHSLLIYKDGKLVVEEYFSGHHFSWEHAGYRGEWVEWDADEWHVNMSVTKSYTSAIVGLAIREGNINSVHDSIFDYLPDRQRFATGGKEDITIEHLLTMTSGLEWDEWSASHTDRANDATGMMLDRDPVRYVLEKSLAHDPGTHFTYNSGNLMLLSEIVRNTTGMDLDEFARTRLFEPLGIGELPTWVRWDSGVIAADGGLLQTSREMMKFGVTFLNGGVWDGQQVIDPEWVARSAVPYGDNTGIRVPGTDGGRKGYGYTWWIHPTRHNGEKIDAFYAGGWGGQRIIVIPDLDAVVVFTGGTYSSNTETFAILDKYVLPAME